MSQRRMSLKELDFNNTGAWPREYKIGFCVLLGLLIIGLTWWMFVRDKRTELEGLVTREGELRGEYETMRGRAANLEPLKLQLAQMEQQLQQMLRQLPSKTEMPDLIENLAAATARLNAVIDRTERYLALADPMLRTLDALLPQLEALVATGNDVYRAVSTMPGVSTLGRFTNRAAAEPPREEKPPRRRGSRDKPHPT